MFFFLLSGYLHFVLCVYRMKVVFFRKRNENAAACLLGEIWAGGSLLWGQELETSQWVSENRWKLQKINKLKTRKSFSYEKIPQERWVNIKGFPVPHRDVCLEYIQPVLLSVPFLCIVSIKYQSFVFLYSKLTKKRQILSHICSPLNTMSQCLDHPNGT